LDAFRYSSDFSGQRFGGLVAGHGYKEGMSLYQAYFIPNGLDPTGMATVTKAKNGKITIEAGSCEIVIVVDHGGDDDTVKHVWKLKPGCSAGAFIGCYPGSNQPGGGDTVSTGAAWEGEIFNSDPEYNIAINDTLKEGGSADKKAQSICDKASCKCTEIKITLYAPQGVSIAINNAGRGEGWIYKCKK